MIKPLGAVLAFSFFLTSCQLQNQSMSDTNDKVISKPVLDIETDRLTPELLWSLGRLGEVAISPDGTTILFGVQYFDISENKGNTDLYSMNIDGSDLKQITRTVKSESNIVWRPDGKKIGFLYADDKGSQLWEMNPDGTSRKKITQIEGGINGFKYAPDQSKILYIKDVPRGDLVKDRHPDIPKANAHLAKDLMFRHWDSWSENYSHVFVANYNKGSVDKAIDIMEGEKFESPKKPFGGMEQISWAPDSKSLVYTCVKKYGKDYAVSTNSNLYHYFLETKETKNVTEGMLGYDSNPVFSPDGKYLAWESMEHDGYESDLNRLFIQNIESGEKLDCSAGFDQNVHDLVWDETGKNIYFVSDKYATFQLYQFNIEKKEYKAITSGAHDFLSVSTAGHKLIAKKMSISLPTELFSIDLIDGTEKQISHVNDDVLAQLSFGNVEERWVKTSDNKDMLTWVIYPPNFDSTKKYPALLYCQGGPQSSVSQFFSYRWNFQLMAANGYIVVAPNRRGLPSFGHEWNKQISGDYGGQNMKDYLSAIDNLAQEPFVDENRLGAVGASYGGFSVFWLAGNHEKRFKAFIAHDGIFNLEAQYLETEETFFANWDFGGPYWEKNNAVAQKTYASSPHLFVDKWDTPIYVIHGEKDYRVLYSQSLQAFTAAKLRGIPAKYLQFPEENHWVLAPQNGILWQREFFSWLDEWLKE
jgi:dipeptidyl aminopeptidase/acylaminoacyl peptidase